MTVALLAACGGADDAYLASAGAGGADGTSQGVGAGFDPGTGGGTGVGGDDSCADLTLEPQNIPVSMFITVDKSGSMNNNGKWGATKNAFTSFFLDPAADGLNVAMRFWPDGSCDTSCNIAGCAQAQVEMGSLADPAHEQALVNLFNSKSPNGLTPMESALAGAEQYALSFQQAAEAGERIVVVFVTDGEPTVCNQNINVIAQYAADAYAQAEILTFAVGLQGSNENQMNTIAQAGNTGQGYFIGSGNTEQDLLQALKDIQEVAVACTFAMPESPDPNKPVDPQAVNILYAPDGTSDGAAIPYVGSEDGCAGGKPGWYYDDPADPAVIYLCDTTCDTVNANDEGKLEIKVGCKSVVQ